MSAVFLKIVNMSISASWLVLAVLFLRLVLKKAPKWTRVLLWGLVAFRLICPISPESAWSLIPSAETFPEQVTAETVLEIQTGIDPVDDRINDYLMDRDAGSVSAAADDGVNAATVLATVWFSGVLLLLAYTAVSCLRLRCRVREAVVSEGNVCQSENVASPFVLGIVRPRIYVPYSLKGQELAHVLAHERAHIRRRDHWWKPLGFLLLCVHWFNPLMWLAYILLCRDIELACDERVIRDLDCGARADYTQALVACSMSRRMIAVCPLTFGEIGVKERVKAVMNYKKPAFWIVVLTVVACIITAVCFLTDPETKGEVPNGVELVDLDGDGNAEYLLIEELTKNELYSVQILKNDSSVLWSAELGLPHAGWDSYFLYQNDGVTGILRYNPSMFQGYADYIYELYIFPGGVQSVSTSGEAAFSTNPDSEDVWPAEAAAFAAEVNELLSHSKLLISTLDGELYCWGDDYIPWCTSMAD